MKSACCWFLAKMIVFPNRSPPATFRPRVIRCSNTLSTVSLLKSHLLTASASTRSGTVPSSSHSSVPLVLVLFRKLVVLDALALQLDWHRDGLGRHEKVVSHRLLHRIGVGRHAVL